MSQRKLGVILSYVSMGITILSNFIYIPILLHFVSQEEYGVYQIMGSMIAYLSVMDFGLSNTIIRYYSRCLVQKDEKGKENVLAISSIIYGGIAIIAIIVCIGVYQFIEIFYDSSLTAYELSLAKQIYVILAINVVLSIPSHVFSAVIQSHEKFVFYKGIVIIQAILQPIIIIAVMCRNPNVVYIAVIQMILNVSVIICNVFYCFKKIHIKIKLHFWDKLMLKEMLGFSFFVFLGTIVDQINWKTDQMILGAVRGAGMAAIYSISAQLQMAFMNFSTAINNVFLPRISMLAAQSDDMTELNNLFIKVGRIQLFIILYIYGGFLILGEPFITQIWVGEEYKEAYWFTVIVMTSIIIPLSQNTGIFILQAKNKHAFRAVLYTIFAIFHLGAAVILARYWGGIGCALAMAVTQVIGNTIIINIYYKKKIGISIGKYYINLLKMIPLFLMSVTVGIICREWLPYNLFVFLLIGVIYTIVYWFAFIRFIFNSYEKNIIYKFIRKKERV